MRTSRSPSPIPSDSFQNSQKVTLESNQSKRSNAKPKKATKKAKPVERELCFSQQRISIPLSIKSLNSQPLEKKGSKNVGSTLSAKKWTEMHESDQEKRKVLFIQHNLETVCKLKAEQKAKKSKRKLSQPKPQAKPKITDKSQKKKQKQVPKQKKKEQKSIQKSISKKELLEVLSEFEKSINRLKKLTPSKQSKMSPVKKSKQKVFPQKQRVFMKISQSQKNCPNSAQSSNSMKPLSTSMQQSLLKRMGTRRNPNPETLNITKKTLKMFEEYKHGELKSIYYLYYHDKKDFMRKFKREKNLSIKDEEKDEIKPMKKVKKEDLQEWQQLLNFTFGSESRPASSKRKISNDGSDEWDCEYLEQTPTVAKLQESFESMKWNNSEETVYQGYEQKDQGLFWC